MEYYQEFPDFEENIEKIFNQDVRDKKVTGSGVRGRALRLRKNENVVMPSDRLSGFEKKSVKAPGVCRTYNILEANAMEMLERIRKGEIPFYAEIEELGFEKAQECLAELRRLYKNSELQREWKLMSNRKFQNLYDKYMITKVSAGNVLIGTEAMERKGMDGRRGNSGPRKRKTNSPSNENQIVNSVDVTPETYVATPFIKKSIIEEDYNAVFVNRTFKYPHLSAFLERLTLYLDPNCEFEVEIKIKQIEVKENE